MLTRDVPPSASALISSLRGVGYSLETAIADIVDNSIAAKATTIEIEIDLESPHSIITICDDGEGMSELQLVEAMRFGGAGPQTNRAATDLGRFGLGLKTASLSQCRQLTVASERGSAFSAFTWDVDAIERGGGAWELVDGAPNVPPTVFDKLRSRPSGTLIIWQKVDFGRQDDRPDEASLLGDVNRLDRHLGMVFHRFLDGDARRLSIKINGRKVDAWDPFLEHHEATIPQPVQRIHSPGGVVLVRGFVLPHRDRFRNDTEFEQAGGPEGWNAQQGFYVYRQRRLLSAGGWLGLGGSRAWTREEPSRLARIRIDIPNTADRDWRIDIRKAIARPPDLIRKRLQAIAEDIRRKAREVFVHRGAFGARPKDAATSRIWDVRSGRGPQRYTIRREHELIRALQQRLEGSTELLEATIELIERTVPIERVWLDVAENGVPAADDDERELVAAAGKLVDVLIAAGSPFDAAVGQVQNMDPFDRVQDLSKKISQKKQRVAR